MRKEVKDVKTIACVGVGTIGAGWAAFYLSRGFNVIASDPGQDAENNLRKAVDDAWPIVMRLNPHESASRERLSFTSNLEAAVSDADFVQESAPDREELKIALFREIDSVAPKDCIIASSSSDFLPTRLAG
jgi:carnitine 3-dehydrogenase